MSKNCKPPLQQPKEYSKVHDMLMSILGPLAGHPNESLMRVFGAPVHAQA